MNNKAIKLYKGLGIGKLQRQDEPCNALLNCKLGNETSPSERAVLALPSMKLEALSNELVQLHKQENTLLGHIKQVNKREQHIFKI